MDDQHAPQFDRAAEDLGNIVSLEHVNTRIPDQRLSTLFHVTGLGFTRDPYLMTSTDNMWINIGRSQFHLPTGAPQAVRGRVGLVVPDLAALALWKAAVFCEAIYGRFVRGELAAEDAGAARYERGVPLLAETALGRLAEIR
mgnify:CR=1 FL=1